jgi:List-Bact-rpt repeat protein
MEGLDMDWKRRFSLGIAAVILACAPVVHAQTASVSGILGSFDVVNQTGIDAHGFEIQLEGAVPSDLYYTGFGQRYGAGTSAVYPTGMYVRWSGAYDPSTSQWSKTTVNHIGNPSFAWQDCYLGGAGYASSGCEAMGQGLRYPYSPGLVATGRWLVEDPQNPGTLIASNPGVAIPLIVTYSVAPATTTFTAPVVVAVVEAPEPPQSPELFGDAQWVKVYKTTLTREVTQADLDDLSSIIPTDPTQIETAWDILQVSPPSNGNQKQKRHQNQGSIAADTRAIVRRYETYKYTGAYDPLTHQVQCADLTCTAPSAGELGDFIGAHNSAINVTADSLTVASIGGGAISDSTGKIKCGSACGVFAPSGTAITLTENPGGLVFTGWSGACSGTQTTCTVTVNGPVQAAATFLPQFTLSVGRSNPGTVVGTPNGNDRALNCGSFCSAKFTQGAAVTLTAIPPDGKTFASWSGSCSGTAPTCTLTIAKDTSVQANFNK